MKLTTRDKVLITVILAILYWWAFGCGQSPQPTPASLGVVTNTARLKEMYGIYNEAYFHGRLTQTPDIDMLEPNSDNMASTLCKDSLNGLGVNCVIHFNPQYVAAPRVGDLTMLHEMCHIQTWMKDMDALGVIEHGHNWRACMMELDMQGAFRQIVIDNYAQETP